MAKHDNKSYAKILPHFTAHNAGALRFLVYDPDMFFSVPMDIIKVTVLKMKDS